MTRQALLLFLAIIGFASCAETGKRNNGLDPILAADREAQVGWVVFKAYPDSTFQYSLSSRGEDKYSGTFRLKGDTLFLMCKDTTIGIETVVIREGSIEFFGKQSPRFAAISINKISQ